MARIKWRLTGRRQVIGQAAEIVRDGDAASYVDELDTPEVSSDNEVVNSVQLDTVELLVVMVAPGDDGGDD